MLNLVHVEQTQARIRNRPTEKTEPFSYSVLVLTVEFHVDGGHVAMLVSYLVPGICCIIRNPQP